MGGEPCMLPPSAAVSAATACGAGGLHHPAAPPWFLVQVHGCAPAVPPKPAILVSGRFPKPVRSWPVVEGGKHRGVSWE